MNVSPGASTRQLENSQQLQLSGLNGADGIGPDGRINTQGRFLEQDLDRLREEARDKYRWISIRRHSRPVSVFD